MRGLHCKCDIDAEKRYICHFPEDNTIISVNSGYGGNMLLGKKCFYCAAFLSRLENGWLAEHMLILGIEAPNGENHPMFPQRSRLLAAKTNLAMMIPPEGYKAKGIQSLDSRRRYRLDADRRDGRLAINPEAASRCCTGNQPEINPNALATRPGARSSWRCA